MPFYGEADIDVMLKEFGLPVEVTTNGVTYYGFGVEDTTDEERLSAEAASFTATFRVVVVKTGTFIGLVPGSSVNVDGTTYKCVQTRRDGDGATTRVWLR